ATSRANYILSFPRGLSSTRLREGPVPEQLFLTKLLLLKTVAIKDTGEHKP
ncbi:hypothetical protein EMPG_12398, partial [Blastomyces silverae]